jgi:two-component system chemotaxis sensor kinase CheA
MKANKAKNIGHHKIANTGAIGLVVFLGASSFIQTIQSGTDSNTATMGFFTVMAFILLLIAFKAMRGGAFFVPVILFLYNAALLILKSGNSHYFLPVCFCICVISCLYASFPMSVFYIVTQAVIAGVLYAMGYPIVGPNMPLVPTAVTGFVFLLSCVLLLALTKTATLELNRALNEEIAFYTFLSTTANYLAMLDNENKVTYASKPLLQLTGLEDPELTKGRPLIDLFPGRDMKLLASKMLGQSEFYEADWEFVLDGQKRFFKAASNSMSGTKGALVTLHDLTFLAERDEIAAMKDSLKIGLFFMDRNYVIQDNYSRYLEELLSDQKLNGQKFTDLLSTSVSSKEMNTIQDYFGMVSNRTFDQMMLEDINPLRKLHYTNTKTKAQKIFQCEFVPVERGRGEVFILVTIYDITVEVELQQRLEEEEKRRQEEMSSLFELLQVDPNVFSDFLEDAEYEFARIDETLKSHSMSTHEVLVEIYQSIHAIKSNAVILGLNTFGEKVHGLESEIKKLREQETEVLFEDMLHLTLEIEKIAHEKDGFSTTIDKIKSFKVEGIRQNQNQYVLIETLTKTANKAAADLGKKVQFTASDIDPKAIEKGPRRMMKEVLMQLIRNSVVHGIEKPEDRLAKGKTETGTIWLSIKTEGKQIHVSLGDDGRGLDFEKIRREATRLNLIKREDENNRSALLKVIFATGFSTAEAEGLHAGRGVGLNLVRDRVSDEKGTIKLQTEADKGTIFNIFLPLKDDAPEQTAS